MHVDIPYGRGTQSLDLSGLNVTAVSDLGAEPLADERAAFAEAVRQPIGCAPLQSCVRRGERIAVVVPDITRAFPAKRLLPWLIEELPAIHKQDITIIIGTGTHRVNTDGEVRSMLGDQIVSDVRVVNHSAFDQTNLEDVGVAPRGYPVKFHKSYVEADRRILLGFIEPHFVAGFSGGYKAIFPGIADIDAIGRYHDAETIAHERSTWGILEGNPTQKQVREAGVLAPADFLINLTLDHQQRITGFFCGNPVEAHSLGCDFVRRTAMASVSHRFPIVITSNGGYPLDQNLYQSVKGMSAAAQIAEPNALIVVYAECIDGFPDHGSFRTELYKSTSPQGILDEIMKRTSTMRDQWQVQLLAKILVNHRVALYSSLAPNDVERAHLTPVDDVEAMIRAEVAREGPDTAIAVMPHGPYVIPYVKP